MCVDFAATTNVLAGDVPKVPKPLFQSCLLTFSTLVEKRASHSSQFQVESFVSSWVEALHKVLS